MKRILALLLTLSLLLPVTAVQTRVNGGTVNNGPVQAMQYLGSTSLPVTAATSSIVTFSPRDEITFIIRIASYPGGADIAALRFNSDSTANYWDRHITFAPAGATGADVPTPNSTMIRVAGNAVTTGRIVQIVCSNFATRPKACFISVLTATGAPATVGTLDIGGGEYDNVTNQITSVQLVTSGGLTMGPGTGVQVYGRNF